MYLSVVPLNGMCVTRMYVLVLAGCPFNSIGVHAKHCFACIIFLLSVDILLRYEWGLFRHWHVRQMLSTHEKPYSFWKWWESHTFVENSTDLRLPSAFLSAGNFKATSMEGLTGQMLISASRWDIFSPVNRVGWKAEGCVLITWTV